MGTPFEGLPVVDLDPPDPLTRSVWREALVLLQELEGDWTLVGGLMVQLHAARSGVAGIRPTVDIDVLANSRQRPSATERIGRKLLDLGFEVTDTLIDPPTAFRFERGGAVVDLLAPEGTGPRNPPKSVGNFQTVGISGGTQALERTETVLVKLENEATPVRCPTLLAAILLKARAIRSKHRDQDRDDLVVLLSCVEDPADLRSQLKRREGGWLRAAAAPLKLDDPSLGDRFESGQVELARVTFRILAS